MKPVYITAWEVSMKNSGGAGMHPTDFSSISNQDKWRTTIGGTLALLSFLLFVAVGPAVATFANLDVALGYVVIIVVPGLIAGLAAYIMRPARFRMPRQSR